MTVVIVHVYREAVRAELQLHAVHGWPSSEVVLVNCSCCNIGTSSSYAHCGTLVYGIHAARMCPDGFLTKASLVD